VTRGVPSIEQDDESTDMRQSRGLRIRARIVPIVQVGRPFLEIP